MSEARRLRELERENAELKKMVAEQSLDIRMLKDVNSKNVWSAPRLQPVSYRRHERVCTNVSGL